MIKQVSYTCNQCFQFFTMEQLLLFFESTGECLSRLSDNKFQASCSCNRLHLFKMTRRKVWRKSRAERLKIWRNWHQSKQKRFEEWTKMRDVVLVLFLLDLYSFFFLFFFLTFTFTLGCRSSALCRNMDKGFTQRWRRWLAILRISSLTSKAPPRRVWFLRPGTPPQSSVRQWSNDPKTRHQVVDDFSKKKMPPNKNKGAKVRKKNKKHTHFCSPLSSWGIRVLSYWGSDPQRMQDVYQTGGFPPVIHAMQQFQAGPPWLWTFLEIWESFAKKNDILFGGFANRKKNGKTQSGAIEVDFFWKMKTFRFFFGHRRILVWGDMEYSSCPMRRDKAQPLVASASNQMCSITSGQIM